MAKSGTVKSTGLVLACLALMSSMNVFAIGPVKVGGVIQTDLYTFGGDNDQNFDEEWDIGFSHGANMRRADLYVKGEIDELWSYQISYALSVSQLDDTWLAFSGFDPLWFAFGRVTAPQGLENWNSSVALTFMERPQVSNAFAPGSGLGLYGDGALGDTISYQAAVLMGDFNEVEYNGGDPWTYSSRAVYHPFAEPGKVLQIGASGYYQKFRDDEPFNPCDLEIDLCPGFYATNPGIRTRENKYLVSSVVPLDPLSPSFGHVINWDIEFAAAYGPVLVEAEYEKLYVYGVENISNLTHDGWYVQGSYMLTCESRAYDAKSATFGNVEPYSIYGAWEVAMRYDTIDLGDSGEGWYVTDETGTQRDWTFGVNWYVNDFVKFQANYVYARANYNIAENREIQSFGFRAQVRF